MRLCLAIILLSLNLQAKEIITLGNASKLAQSPDNCLKSKSVCAFKTAFSEKFKFKVGDSQVVLDENTAVVRQSDKKLTLVSGQIWVRADGEIEVQTEYGSVTAFTGNFLVKNLGKNADKRMEVKAIDNLVRLSPKAAPSESHDLKLEAGEQNWLGPVDQDRMTSSGIPLPILPSELVVNWARLYTGTKIQFEEDFKNFFAKSKEASERLASLHADLTRRQIASVDDELKRKKQIEKARARENKRIKDWYRQRELSD